MAAPKKIDYERIEPGWRAGLKSPPQLATEYTAETGVSCSHAAIVKHFKKLGIPRDLAAKVKAKADSMVMQAMVTGKVQSENLATTAKIIETAATEVAVVRIEHRVNAKRARTLGLTLLSELEAQSADLPALQSLGTIMRRDDERGQDRLNDLYQKIISTPGRIDGAKKVVETLKIAIGLEREAYGLDEDPTGKDGAAPGEAKQLSDAERASRLAALLERARRRTEVGDDAPGP